MLWLCHVLTTYVYCLGIRPDSYEPKGCECEEKGTMLSESACFEKAEKNNATSIIICYSGDYQCILYDLTGQEDIRKEDHYCRFIKQTANDCNKLHTKHNTNFLIHYSLIQVMMN